MSDQTPPSPEEKRRVHFEKAKRASLGFVQENGGTCPMGDMHNFSESRYFIAHQQFSMLLEDCVSEGLVEVDDYTVTLTEKGQAFVSDAEDPA